MSRYLKVDRWFDRTSTGTLRRKRVSAEREKQFCLRYRKVYQLEGASKLTKLVKDERGLSLAEAWSEVKRMFND